MTVRFSPTRLKLLGSGSALPGPSVSSDSLIAHLRHHCGDRPARLAAKFARRLGIVSRHVSRDLNLARSGTQNGVSAPELCQQAMNKTGSCAELSFLIGHTATPHTLLPSNIAWVADALGYSGPHVELRQACTGFAASLMTAAAMIAEQSEARIGIVGSETGSPFFDISNDFLDTQQIINFVQMGDGAGAVVVGADDGTGEAVISDIYYGQMGLNQPPGISLEGGGSARPTCKKGLPYFAHQAGEVGKQGEQLILAGIEAISNQGYAIEDFDWIIPHQANGHMAKLFGKRFPACKDKVFVVADRLGNLGSAAIWVALDVLRRSNKLQSGHRVLVLGAEASKYMYGGFIYTH